MWHPSNLAFADRQVGPDPVRLLSVHPPSCVAMKQPEHIPDGPFFRMLIPPEPRSYPGRRWDKMVARAAHVIVSGIYLGAFVFKVQPESRWPWFVATLLSGLLVVCLDLFESGGFLLQLRDPAISFPTAGTWRCPNRSVRSRLRAGRIRRRGELSAGGTVFSAFSLAWCSFRSAARPIVGPPR